MHTASDTTTDDDRLLTSKEAAARIRIKPGTLKLWRSQGRGPRYIKRGNTQQAAVRYRVSDVEAWLRDRSQHVVIEPTK